LSLFDKLLSQLSRINLGFGDTDLLCLSSLNTYLGVSY